MRVGYRARRGILPRRPPRPHAGQAKSPAAMKRRQHWSQLLRTCDHRTEATCDSHTACKQRRDQVTETKAVTALKSCIYCTGEHNHEASQLTNARCKVKQCLCLWQTPQKIFNQHASSGVCAYSSVPCLTRLKCSCLARLLSTRKEAQREVYAHGTVPQAQTVLALHLLRLARTAVSQPANEAA